MRRRGRARLFLTRSCRSPRRQALGPRLFGPRGLFDHLVGERASFGDRAGNVLRFNRTER